jgi:Putative DNA-binding domain
MTFLARAGDACPSSTPVESRMRWGLRPMTPSPRSTSGDSSDMAGALFLLVMALLVSGRWTMQPVRMQLTDLSAQLAGAAVFVRAVVERMAEPKVLQFEVLAGEQPLDWTEAVWKYQNMIFVAQEMPGTALAAALSADGAGAVVLADMHASVVAVHRDVNGERQPSRARRFQTPRLPWPVTEFQLTPNDAAAAWMQKPSGFLVGEDCPSFPDYQTAWRAFTTNNYSMVGAQDNGRFGLIRVVDQTAWLSEISITATHLHVVVSGTDAGEISVEVNSGGFRESQAVGETGEVRFHLPDGLPDDAWLFLKRGTRLVDYRAVGRLLTSPQELAEAGVNLILPEDPESQIQALLAAGEGPTVEYKRELPGDSTEAKRKVLKTVAAFANGESGDIVFGMDPDEVTVYGLGSQNVGPTARDRIGNLIHSIVVPTPEFQVRHYSIDGKNLLVLSVRQGRGGPYGLQFGKAQPEFYVRRGSNTYPAGQDDIRYIARVQA